MVADSIGTHRIDGKRKYTAVARGPRGRSVASEVSESQLLGATGAGKPRLGDPRAAALFATGLAGGRAWNHQANGHSTQ
jgi:hypothetical protein